MSIYETKTMLQAIEQKKPVFTFLRDTFFPNIETLLTEKAEVDIKKGKRKLAPFVAPRIGGKVMKREGFKTSVITTPKIAPIRVITADDIKKRTPGESVYSTKTPEERAIVMLANDLVELDDAITRREEWMCAQVLLGEVIDIDVEGATQSIDFGFTNEVILSAGKKWNAAGTDPLVDLKDWRQKIIKATGKTPDICIMSDNVVDAFIGNTKVKELLDIQRLNVGAIEPSYQGAGVTFIGKLPSLGLEIYSYTEYYIADDEEETEMQLIPDGKVIVGATKSGKRYYGAVTQKEKGSWITYEGIRVPKYTNDDKNEIDELRLTARPLPTPEDVDSWVVATVL
ncbi:major capsid protein [Clostridium beijerinckii]|nr:major capsid protein [Clostridium beijerinckii]